MPFAVIAVCMFSLCGLCKDDKDPDSLEATPLRLNFEADDIEEKVITITTNVVAWSYVESDDWVDAYKKTGEADVLYVKVKNYTDTSSPRTGSITIKAGEATPVTITVEQKAKKIDVLTANPESLEFQANESGTKTIAIVTDSKEGWSVKTENQWITLSKVENTIEVKVGANTSANDRNGTIIVNAGNAPEKRIPVKQSGETTLKLSTKDLSFGYAASSGNVTVETNAGQWTSSTDASSWISLSQPNSSRLTVTVTRNTTGSSRSGNVTVKANNKEERITVTQAKEEITLSVSTNNLSFGYNETATKSVQVTTNSPSWNSSTTASWLTLTKSGTSLSVRAATNSTSSSRTGTITITTEDGKLSETVTVTQEGNVTISASPNLTFTYNETTSKTIQVTTNASSWSASSNVSWLTLTKSTSSISVRAATNSTSSSRTGTITFTTGDGKATATVSVTQTPGTPIPTFAIYDASGTPEMLQTPGPSRWAGIFLQESGQRYSITGWGGLAIKSFLNYSNNRFIIEYQTSVVTDASNSQIKGYFVAFIVSGGSLTVIVDYPISYNSSTRTIDFSGRESGINVWVGVIAVKGALSDNFQIEGFYTECYSNAKVVFDISSSAPQMNNNTETRSQILSSDKANIDISKIKTVKRMTYEEFKSSQK